MIFLLKVNRTPTPPLLNRPVEPKWKETGKWVFMASAVTWMFIGLMRTFGPDPSELQSAVNFLGPVLMMIPMAIAIIRKIRFRYMMAISLIACSMGEGMALSLEEFATPEFFNTGVIILVLVDTIVRSIAAGFIFKRWYA